MAPAGAVKIQILNHLAAPCDGMHRLAKCQSIGALTKEKEEKEKKKDNPYKLNKAMAIAIGLQMQLDVKDLHQWIVKLRYGVGESNL